MKTIVKIIPILIILLIIPICFPCTTYAMSEIISQGDDFIGQGGTETIDKDALNTTSKYIYNVLFTIAVVIAFAIGIIIGIQFIVGSVDEKAKIKETLVPYIIGVCIIFGAFTIWKIVVTIGEQVSPTPNAPSAPAVNVGYCPNCREQLTQEQITLIEQHHSITCRNCGQSITNYVSTPNP